MIYEKPKNIIKELSAEIPPIEEFTRVSSVPDVNEDLGEGVYKWYKSYGDEVPPWSSVLGFVARELKQQRETLIAEIQKLKETTQTETGSYKYDFAYDEVVELIKKLK